jgi:hypothetical protein
MVRHPRDLAKEVLDGTPAWEDTMEADPASPGVGLAAEPAAVGGYP